MSKCGDLARKAAPAKQSPPGRGRGEVSPAGVRIRLGQFDSFPLGAPVGPAASRGVPLSDEGMGACRGPRPLGRSGPCKSEQGPHLPRGGLRFRSGGASKA